MERRKSVEILLNMELEDLQKMSRADLARNVSKLASAANKRIVRIEKAGIYSPSVEYVKKHGGKFSVAGKNKQQLLIEYNRVADFLISKTSSVRGTKKWEKDVAKGVKDILKGEQTQKATGEKKTKKEQREEDKQWEEDWLKRKNDFWKLYSRLQDNFAIGKKYREAWQIIDTVLKENSGKTFDEIYVEVEKRWKAYFKKTQGNSTEDESDLNVKNI